MVSSEPTDRPSWLPSPSTPPPAIVVGEPVEQTADTSRAWSAAASSRVAQWGWSLRCRSTTGQLLPVRVPDRHRMMEVCSRLPTRGSHSRRSPLPPNESGSAQWSCRLPVSAGQGRPRSRDAGPAQRRPAHARGRPRQRPVRTGALDHRRQPGTPDQLAEVVAELSALRRGVGIAEAQPYDIVADVEPGTDPVPYAAASATWWLVGHTTSTRVGAEKWRTS
jgi:hypothetical protein